MVEKEKKLLGMHLINISQSKLHMKKQMQDHSGFIFTDTKAISNLDFFFYFNEVSSSGKNCV